ncbi:MAG: hypothetical protein LBR80_14825 [Deltaproteobacteria bacterium]|jgi:hypothetical protein|nr:hypothetical protein [Deltaproteobacteria bacterium]
MTPQETGKYFYLGRKIHNTLHMLPMTMASQIVWMLNLRLPLSKANEDKLIGPLTSVLSRVCGKWKKRIDGKIPPTLAGRESLVAELDPDMGRVGLAFKTLDAVKKRPLEADEWLSTLASPPTPEMIFERLVPDEWRKLTTSSSPSPEE